MARYTTLAERAQDVAVDTLPAHRARAYPSGGEAPSGVRRRRSGRSVWMQSGVTPEFGVGHAFVHVRASCRARTTGECVTETGRGVMSMTRPAVESYPWARYGGGPLMITVNHISPIVMELRFQSSRLREVLRRQGVPEPRERGTSRVSVPGRRRVTCSRVSSLGVADKVVNRIVNDTLPRVSSRRTSHAGEPALRGGRPENFDPKAFSDKARFGVLAGSKGSTGASRLVKPKVGVPDDAIDKGARALRQRNAALKAPSPRARRATS